MSELNSLRLVLAVARAAVDPKRDADFRALALGRLALEIMRHDAAMGRSPQACEHTPELPIGGGTPFCAKCGATFPTLPRRLDGSLVPEPPYK